MDDGTYKDRADYWMPILKSLEFGELPTSYAPPEKPRRAPQPVTFDIPEKLQFLRSALPIVVAFDSEELDEENIEVQEAVESAMRRHLRGMSPDEASTVLDEIVAELDVWHTSDDAPPCAPYLYGFILGMSCWADLDDFTQKV